MVESLPATELVRAVAQADGVEPTELDVRLQDYIDVDAIERLVAHDSSSWSLSFELSDHDVTITGSGVILIDGTRRTELELTS